MSEEIEEQIQLPEKATSEGTAAKKEEEREITAGSTNKDDCSDLTDNNQDGTEEVAPKSFPQKLMEMLSDERFSDVISWLPHGKGFIIHKKKVFAADLLPTYFKASKFTSFTRKLNRWGFVRVARGPETGAYYNKLFLRDQPDLCLQMTSNSGNKYQNSPLQQNLLPNLPVMPMPGGYMWNPMMANMSPQQQQAMWQHQMQQMFQMQQMHMMQMQQQQHHMQPPNVGSYRRDEPEDEEDKPDHMQPMLMNPHEQMNMPPPRMNPPVSEEPVDEV